MKTQFIEFTAYPDDSAVFVNIDHIIFFRKGRDVYNNLGYMIYTSDGDHITVKEDAAEKISKHMARNYIGL